MWHSFKWALPSFFTIKTHFFAWCNNSCQYLDHKLYGNGIHCMKKEKMAKHLRIFSPIFWCEIDGWYFFIAFIYPGVATRSLMGLQMQGTIHIIKCVHYVMVLLILVLDDNWILHENELGWIHMELRASLDIMGEEFFIHLPPRALSYIDFLKLLYCLRCSYLSCTLCCYQTCKQSYTTFKQSRTIDHSVFPCEAP
jgi:hypothetical protein